VSYSEASKAAPTAIIEMFVLELNSTQHGITATYRFHGGTNLVDNGPITWAGNSYTRLPIEADGFEYTGSGTLPRPRLRVANLLGTITGLLATLPGGLEGARVTRIRTFARFLDAVNFPGGVNPYGTPSPSTELPREVYFIDRKVMESREAVEYELAAAFDLAGVRLPKRMVLDNLCPWVYKSAQCSYSGGLPTCAKTLADCKAHFGGSADLPFGGFPGVGGYV
jgi:lambda family phage minor tail protein L